MSKGVSLVAIRYARSLFTIADEKERVGGTGSSYGKAFASLEELFSIKEAYQILKSPVMPKELKSNLLQLALKDGHVDDSFKNFVSGILEANRVTLIPEIGKAYEALLIEKRNEKKAKVFSAHPLSNDLVNKIQQSLTDLFGKKVLMTLEVDEKLLGGFVVEIENYLLDYSLLSAVNFSMR